MLPLAHRRIKTFEVALGYHQPIIHTSRFPPSCSPNSFSKPRQKQLAFSREQPNVRPLRDCPPDNTDSRLSAPSHQHKGQPTSRTSTDTEARPGKRSNHGAREQEWRRCQGRSTFSPCRLAVASHPQPPTTRTLWFALGWGRQILHPADMRQRAE